VTDINEIGDFYAMGAWLRTVTGRDDEALGFALPGYEMRVVDDEGGVVPTGQIGELQVKGPGMLSVGDHATTTRPERQTMQARHARTGPATTGATPKTQTSQAPSTSKA